MLSEYIQAAIDAITWNILEDGTFYSEIPQLGLNAASAHLEECQCRMRAMLEEHIVTCLCERKPLPVIGGKELSIKQGV